MSRSWCEWCNSHKVDALSGRLDHNVGCCLSAVRVTEFSQIPDEHYCSKCRAQYVGGPHFHSIRECVYELGCPTCRDRFRDIHHAKACAAKAQWLRDEKEVAKAGKGPLELLSYYKPTIASSVQMEGLDAKNATDGRDDTRWSSKFSDLEWIMVDLQRVCRIDKVILSWEVAYAKHHELQFSMDAVNWNVVFSQKKGRGGIEVIPLLGVGTYNLRHARFVRISCFERATQWGYSMYAFEILGERIATFIQPPKPDMSNKTPPEQILASEWWAKEPPQGTIKVIDERNNAHVAGELLP